MKFRVLLSGMLGVVFSSLVVSAEAEVDKFLAANEPTEKMLGFANMLNEFSARRRLNTFFVNEQSPFDGVQHSFVNTSTGNLTFLRRDLVRLGRMPLVFGRVYDSRIENNSDFGPGWKLAPFESLEATEKGLRYTDSSNSSYDFEETEAGFVLQTPFYSDFLHIESLEGVVEITYRNLWSRVFERDNNKFWLTQVQDNNGNSISFEYESGRLLRIVSDHGAVTLERDAAGQVNAVVDDLGRRVEYRYDDKARLSEVADLGGKVWRYGYNNRNLLVEMTDPNGNKALTVAFDPGSRAAHASIRSARYHFVYSKGKTNVRDIDGGMTVYEYNELGLTQSVTSPTGTIGQVGFDKSNRVSTLHIDGELTAEMSYDPSGNLESLARFDGSGAQTIRYDYNWHNNVITARSSTSFMTLTYDDNGNLLSRLSSDVWGFNPKKTEYAYDLLGNLTRYHSTEGEHTFAHTEQGLINQVKHEGVESLNLRYDEAGRLTFAGFLSGETSTYAYDALGMRQEEIRSDGTKRTFRYDAAGNLTSLDGSTGERTSSSEYKLNQFNQVTHITQSFETEMGDKREDLTISYDGRGRPTSISGIESGDLAFGYDQQGRLSTVRQRGRILARHNYQDGEPDVRLTEDSRTGVVTALAVRNSAIFNSLPGIAYARAHGSLYGAVGFSGGTRSLVLNDSWGLPVADDLIRSALQRAKLTDQKGDQQMVFNKPSNSMFLSPEYASVNCCAGSLCDLEAGTCNPDYCEPGSVFCLGQVTSVTPSITSAKVAGSPISFSSSITVNAGTPQHETWVDNSASFFWDFDDGSTSTQRNPSHTFGAPGVYQILVTASSILSCDIPVVVSSSIFASVTAPPPACNTSGRDTVARDYLKGRPTRRPYEEGVTIECTNNIAVVGSKFTGPNINSSTAERCEMPGPFIDALIANSSSIGIGHTHPFFDENEVSKKIVCHGQEVIIQTVNHANQINANNNSFSGNDVSAGNRLAGEPGYPISPPNAIELYLRRSTQNSIYKYNNGSNGSTGVKVP